MNGMIDCLQYDIVNWLSPPPPHDVHHVIESERVWIYGFRLNGKLLIYIFSLLFSDIYNHQRVWNCEQIHPTAIEARMPSIKPLGAIITLLGLSILLENVLLVGGQQNNPPQQVCPPLNDIDPCACTVKKNGLDILCEGTDILHINKAMGALKGKSPIIFYLKLRHNNLPKLQGFLFLALDIRHLTIHNSSLAAIEETSLSSLGKYLLLL